MKRRHMTLIAGATLLVAVVLALVVAPARAQNYQYTVRVFPGNRGTLSQDPVSVTVDKGGSVDLYSIATATITDNKYVQTGFRLSGTDTLLGNGIINGISEDMDYVVAYGVESDVVPYTLRFVEYETGRELAEPKTYYGKNGDKPVAAYEYIEGYRPRYLAITGTLHKDEENVWTFEYIPLEEGETTVVTTTTTRTSGTTTSTVIQGEEVQEGTTNAGTQGQGQGQGQGQNQGQSQGQGQSATDATSTGTQGGPETQEILDLDTPLAGPGNGVSKIVEKGGLLLQSPKIIATVIIAIALCAGLFWFFVKREKDEQNDKEEA